MVKRACLRVARIPYHASPTPNSCRDISALAESTNLLPPPPPLAGLCSTDATLLEVSWSRQTSLGT